MLNVPQSWKIYVRLEPVIARQDGAGLPEHATLEEWSYQFSKDLRRLKLSARTNNAIARAAMVTTKRSEYEPSQRGTVEKDVEPYIPNPEAFRFAGQLLTFSEWVGAIKVGRIRHMDLLGIRGFGSKSLRELLEAVDKLDLPSSSQQGCTDMPAEGDEIHPLACPNGV